MMSNINSERYNYSRKDGLGYDLNNNMILSHSKSVYKSKYFEIVAAVDKDKK